MLVNTQYIRGCNLTLHRAGEFSMVLVQLDK